MMTGYICSQCQSWVPTGFTHTCPFSAGPITVGGTVNTQWKPVDPMIVALNEIRDALRAIHESIEKTRKRDTLWDE